MVIFLVLWPYLLTFKLRYLQKNDIGHTIQGGKEIEICNWTVNLVYNRKNFDWEPNQSPIHDENSPMRSEERVFGNEQGAK